MVLQTKHRAAFPGGVAGRKKTGPIVVIGDIMADIAIKPEGDVRFGSDTASEIRLGVGGTGANTSIHLARLGLSVVLLGRVGGDDLGRFVSERLDREGVRLPGARVEGTATGAIGILVDGTGQRTMFPQQGANAFVDGDFIRAWWPSLPSSSEKGEGGSGDIAALFVSGYALFRERTREGTLWAMEQARAMGAPVFVDPASYAFIEDVGVKRFLEWTQGATVLLPNREEAGVLSGIGPEGQGAERREAPEREADEREAEGRRTLAGARAAIRRLGERFPVVVVTLDGDGALACSGDGEWHIPGVEVPVVDTTGAGDAFNAAFVAAYVAGEGLPEAVAAGNRLAASVVQKIGPT